MADIKISELEPTTDLEGLYTIGADKNNLSKKVSLQFLKDAANYANEQGDYAKQAGDTVNGNVGVSDYPEFSASKSYVIGDIVRYNGVLYSFTANHAASAWNGSDVKATSINAITSGKLTELESELFGVGGNLPIEYDDHFIAVGDGVITGDEVNDGEYKTSALVKVSDVIVKGKYGYSQALCAFYDKDKKFIKTFPSSYYDGQTSVDGLLADVVGGIPVNAKYARYTLTKGATLEVYDTVANEVAELQTITSSLQTLTSSAKKPLSINKQIETSIIYNRLLQADGSDIYANGTYIISNYVPVRAGDIYRVNATAVGTFCFYVIYDIDKQVLQYAASTASYDNQTIDQDVKIPNNGCYIRLAGKSDGYPFAIFDYTYTLESDSWQGKKWAAIGDSLTEKNLRTNKNYADYIVDATSINLVNLGISGTGYRHSMPFYTRIADIPSDVNLITIFGSGNDLNHGYTMGDATSTDINTICGCINRCISDIQSSYPLIPFGIITPTPWENCEPNEVGNPFIEYCEKIVEICKLRGVPCLDLYHCSNLHPSNAAFRALAYTKDDGNGVHPDENGHKIIYPRILEFLKSLVA